MSYWGKSVYAYLAESDKHLEKRIKRKIESKKALQSMITHRPKPKHSNNTVWAIRVLRECGTTVKGLSEIFGITKSLVSNYCLFKDRCSDGLDYDYNEIGSE